MYKQYLNNIMSAERVAPSPADYSNRRSSVGRVNQSVVVNRSDSGSLISLVSFGEATAYAIEYYWPQEQQAAELAGSRTVLRIRIFKLKCETCC